MIELKLTRMVPVSEHVLLTDIDLKEMLYAVNKSDLDKEIIKSLSNKLNKLIESQYENI